MRARIHGRFLALFAGGLLGAPAEAQEAIDMKLSNAGFIMRSADTPEKVTRLRHLPPRKIVARINNGKPFYVYADPDYCRCALVGDAVAMQRFREMGGAQPAAPPGGPQARSVETEIVDQMDADIGGARAYDILRAPF